MLDLNLKAHGQMIVVYKPDRADFTELMPEETAALITLCTRVANAITQGLGAEKVYLVTMCDGETNHLHVQLLPRYPGEAIGFKRLAGARSPLRVGRSWRRRSVPRCGAHEYRQDAVVRHMGVLLYTRAAVVTGAPLMHLTCVRIAYVGM